MKYSKQREYILQSVLHAPGHPTADEIFGEIREQLPRISLGTVYRNLNQLAQAGLIRRISVPGASDRFDRPCFPHCHLVCQVCGQVQDLPLQYVQGTSSLIQRETGFSISGEELTIAGICKTCRKHNLTGFPRNDNGGNKDERTQGQ